MPESDAVFPGKEVVQVIELASLETVEGTSADHDVVLFALSTCPHCRHAREYLDKSGVAYRYVYVDQLQGAEQKDVMLACEKYNPNLTFPTLVVDDDNVIIGFKESEYQERLS